MKIAAIAVFLLIASDISAQTLNINGAVFSLEESEAKARADITAADMTIDKGPGSEGHFLWAKRGDVNDSVGTITFKDGKIYYISRDWYLKQTSNDKNLLAQVFYSAVTSLLEGSHPAVCSVNVQSHDNSPNAGTIKETTVECHRGNYKHSLSLIGVDCSGGCSAGSFTASLSESVQAEKTQ